MADEGRASEVTLTYTDGLCVPNQVRFRGDCPHTVSYVPKIFEVKGSELVWQYVCPLCERARARERQEEDEEDLDWHEY